MRLRAALPALIALLFFVGCADDTPLDPQASSSDPPDGQALQRDDDRFWNEDERVAPFHAEAEGLAKSRHDSDRGVGPTTRTYEVVVENLTPNNGGGAAQVFSPPVLASHNPSVHMFQVGHYASDPLAGVAEDALNQPLVDLLESSRGVGEVVVGDGVIPPGASARYELATHVGSRFLSMAFMLVNTNDGFSGLESLRLPAHGEVELDAYAYDAGSELNDELIANIPGPCCGNPGSGVSTRERIHHHEGITGVGDLDPETWGWQGAVARITVRRLEPAYRLTVRNLTPDTGDGGSQVFSPPVFATHSPRIAMFRTGRLASDELAGIAEDAMNQPMVDLLEASGAALDVQVGGGVIPPGQSAEFTVESAPGHRRLSMAFMLVNTNDGFSGVDRLRLPRRGAVTYRLFALDAGSELNDELVASIPGPCCGNVGTGTDTAEPIHLHPGIEGVGDLDPEKWGWDEPAAELTVERIR